MSWAAVGTRYSHKMQDTVRADQGRIEGSEVWLGCDEYRSSFGPRRRGGEGRDGWCRDAVGWKRIRGTAMDVDGARPCRRRAIGPSHLGQPPYPPRCVCGPISAEAPLLPPPPQSPSPVAQRCPALPCSSLSPPLKPAPFNPALPCSAETHTNWVSQATLLSVPTHPPPPKPTLCCEPSASAHPAARVCCVLFRFPFWSMGSGMKKNFQLRIFSCLSPAHLRHQRGRSRPVFFSFALDSVSVSRRRSFWIGHSCFSISLGWLCGQMAVVLGGCLIMRDGGYCSGF